MEKIQQALERARKQREDADGDIKRQQQAVDVQSIEYTHTQAVSGHAGLQRENRILSAMGHSAYVDAFKMLSTQVMQRMEEHQWKSLAITSAGEDEGKTTTAINLGISIAKEIEYTVLLVDANLREPNIHNYFGVTPEVGLIDYLQGDVDLSEILMRPADLDHFVLLPGGTPVMNSTEMLGSPKMCNLVNELKERYPKRIVIYDLPPTLSTADTLSLVPCNDCALVVVEDDNTKEAELKQAVDMLSVTNILGTVLNKAKY